jgi:hypothetical protein
VDVETVPDREILPDEHATDTFPKPIQHRVMAISFLSASLVREGGTERYTVEDAARVVICSGRGFDLPVLVQRAFVHGSRRAIGTRLVIDSMGTDTGIRSNPIVTSWTPYPTTEHQNR